MLVVLLAVLTILKVSLDYFRGRRGKSNCNAYALKKLNASDFLDVEKTPLGNTIMSNYLGQKIQDQEANEDNLNGGNMDTSVITFKSGEKDYYELRGNKVAIIGSAGTHDHGSSKVKLKNIVDYKWESKHYPGRLIAVHIDGKYIAYAINVNNKSSRMEGMVRVVNPQSGMRALIKGMCGEVLDLQFAHIQNERILASIDMNSLFVHKIDLLEDTLICNLILKVEDPIKNYTPKYDRVSWCPYVETTADDDNENQLIVWLRGSTFQCFNVSTVVTEHGVGKISPKDISTGYLRYHDESLTFTWASLAPDGSTMGVSSTDGIIRFYQVYMHDKDVRCLHQWKPSSGKPISSFFFLDDLTKKTVDAYWKFAVTGAVNNSEFKVWDCGTWECLQTISLTTAADEDKKPIFIAELDRSASYLVVSNLETRTCYVLQIVNLTASKSVDPDKDTSSTSTASTQSSGKPRSMGLVFIKSISDFPLNSGILSFSIVDAAVRRYKSANENYLCDEFDDYDEDTSFIYCVVIRMFIVQSKSMQECHIIYQPMLTEDADVKSSIVFDSSASGMREFSESDDSVTGINICKGNTNNNDSEGSQNDIECEDKLSNISQNNEKSERSALESLLGINTDIAVSPVKSKSVQKDEKTNGSRTTSPQKSASASVNNKAFTQVNLMTPDAFTSVAGANDKKTPEIVSTEVLNTLLMLASVAGQTVAPSKSEGMNLLNLMNNKMLEDQEQQKVQRKAMESQKKFVAIDNNPGRKVSDILASGGSSPSREVQEIMSLQDFDKSPFSGDELLDGKQSNDKIIGPTIAAADLEPSPVTTKPQVTKWPKAPDVPKQKHSAELQNAANLISQAVHASSVGSLNSSHLVPPLISSSSNNNISNNNLSGIVQNTEFADINIQLSQLLELVKLQSKQISNLQKEIVEMKSSNVNQTTKTINEFSFKTEMRLSKLMEQYLKRYENEHNKKLAAFMAGREVQNRELRETFIQIVNQYVLTQMGDVLSKVFTMEIQRQLVPLLAAKLDNMQQQLQLDIGQKLTTFDKMLKDNITQVCKSKSFIEAFGKSVLLGVQGSLQAAFIESMSSTLIPAYEKSSQNMFKQLHDAFSGGIKEFLEQFDGYLQQLQPMQESTEQIVNNFAGFRQHMDTILTKQRNVVMEAMADNRKDVKNMEIMLTRHIQDTLRSELRKCLENSAMTMRSQANTPAPGYDMRETIRNLLHTGQINKAFHQALLANDLSLVEFTLKNADQNAVFTPNCCLEQKVLLSLIQQISADMSHHNELKQNYLAEALLAINQLDPITREHAPKVLQELFRNCQQFLCNYPKSPQCSNVRMLLKAIQAFSFSG